MSKNILVLGSSNIDLILKIPRFHHPGETIVGENLVTAFGGKGANQAIASKRLGGKVILITKLGNDHYGRSYSRYLIKNGLDQKWVLKDKKLPAGGLLAVFLSLYGLFRFFVELFREPDPQLGFILGPFTMGQTLSAFMIIGGIILFLYLRRR